MDAIEASTRVRCVGPWWVPSVLPYDADDLEARELRLRSQVYNGVNFTSCVFLLLRWRATMTCMNEVLNSEDDDIFDECVTAVSRDSIRPRWCVTLQTVACGVRKQSFTASWIAVMFHQSAAIYPHAHPYRSCVPSPTPWAAASWAVIKVQYLSNHALCI